MMTIPQSIRYWRERQIGILLGLVLALGLILGLAGGKPAQAFQAEHPLSGRRIAPVMGVSGADWLERTERESEQNPEAALDAIGTKPGMVVADVGAGTGYMSLRMAKRVGPTGKVFANDVQPEMLRRLRQNAAKEKLSNIETV